MGLTSLRSPVAERINGGGHKHGAQSTKDDALDRTANPRIASSRGPGE